MEPTVYVAAAEWVTAVPLYSFLYRSSYANCALLEIVVAICQLVMPNRLPRPVLNI